MLIIITLVVLLDSIRKEINVMSTMELDAHRMELIRNIMETDTIFGIPVASHKAFPDALEANKPINKAGYIHKEYASFIYFFKQLFYPVTQVAVSSPQTLQ